jgi:hypothetical protein
MTRLHQYLLVVSKAFVVANVANFQVEVVLKYRGVRIHGVSEFLRIRDKNQKVQNIEMFWHQAFKFESVSRGPN